MKQRLIAIAIFLGAAGGGTFWFLNWNTGLEDTTIPDSIGGLEVYDKSRCDVSPCTTPACVVARGHLDDAGYTDALLKLVECPFRIGARARALAADAGFSMPAGNYVQLQLVAMRRPAIDGGFAFGIATKDNGWPMDAVATGTFPCAWKPTAFAACTKIDGGNPGVTNTMQAGMWAGAGCVRKACTEMAGTGSAP